jgi:hypothetical protein
VEGKLLKTLDVLSWKVPDTNGTFNVVSVEDLSDLPGI